MRAGRILLGGVAVLLLLIASAVSPAEAQQLLGRTPLPPPPGKPELIPGQFIVELKAGVGRDAFINEHRVAAFFRYTIINGFAARMSQAAADRLAADARVRSVTPDLVVHAFPKPDKPDKGRGGGGGKGGKGKKAPPADGGGGSECPDLSSDPAFNPVSNPEESSTGVARTDADSAGATGTGVKVAVLDTGIDPCHPDLTGNLKGGVYFVETDFKDYHGHGTHVGGIIGAAQNGFGVIGTAPLAHLYAVKVLDQTGSGASSGIVAGIDWAANNGMQVANLSLGAFDLFLGSNPICNAVNSAVLDYGITVVVAAGNSSFEALYFTPANCTYSTTVTGFADSDGLPGGVGPGLDYNADGLVDESDDTFADFSNYSNYCWDLDSNGVCTEADAFVVDLMAPGVEILSTMPTYTVTLNDPAGANKNLDYDTLTGTSMASPHGAGAAALYLEANPGATPADVRLALTTGGECVDGKTAADSGGLSLVECKEKWPDDPDVAWEPLLDAGGL